MRNIVKWWKHQKGFVKYVFQICEVWITNLWNMKRCGRGPFVKYEFPNCELWNYEAKSRIVNLWNPKANLCTCEFMWPGAICELWTYVATGHLWNYEAMRPRAKLVNLWTCESKGPKADVISCESMKPKGYRECVNPSGQGPNCGIVKSIKSFVI